MQFKPTTPRQLNDFANRAKSRLKLRPDISSEDYTARRGEIDGAIDQMLGMIFPLPAAHLAIAKLPKSDEVKAKIGLGFTWVRQLDFDIRVALVQDYLGRVYSKDVSVQVVRYAGSETATPRVLILNPLEAIAFAGKQVNPVDYSAVSALHLAAHADLIQSNLIKGMLMAGHVRLEESAIKSWGRLPLQPNGSDVVTLWELPVNPATLFHDLNSGVLWSFSHRQAISHVAATQRHPGELISWSTLLAGEPHLKDQIRKGTAPSVDLIGAQVLEEYKDCVAWVKGLCYCESEGELCLGHRWDGRAHAQCGSCAFLPGVA
jgi:hypothetical protein